MDENYGNGNTLSEKLRALGKSPLFLVAVIFQTISVGISIFNMVGLGTMNASEFAEFIEEMGLYQEQMNMSVAHSTFLTSLISANLHHVLMCIGLWIVFLGVRKGGTGSAGFQLMEVIYRISRGLLVAAGIIGAIAICAVLAISGSLGIGIVVAILYALVIVLCWFILSKYVNTIKAGRLAIQDDPSGRFSRFVAVMSIIGGFFTLIDIFEGLDLLLLLDTLAASIPGIIFGVLIFKARKLAMEAQNDAGRNNSYQNEPYQGSYQGYEQSNYRGSAAGEASGFYGEPQAPAQNFAQGEAPYVRLYSVRTGQSFEFHKTPITIGTEESADICISWNPNVSRSHAAITCRQGRFFVIDNYSKGHTFINGLSIATSTPSEIANGDRLFFGDEEFEFYLS